MNFERRKLIRKEKSLQNKQRPSTTKTNQTIYPHNSINSSPFNVNYFKNNKHLIGNVTHTHKGVTNGGTTPLKSPLTPYDNKLNDNRSTSGTNETRKLDDLYNIYEDFNELNKNVDELDQQFMEHYDSETYNPDDNPFNGDPGSLEDTDLDDPIDYMLTTSDNPFNPFEDFDSWFAFDVSKNYFSCSYLARIAQTSESLSDYLNSLEINRAIDAICQMNIQGDYVKVSRKDFEKDKTPNESRS